MSRREKIAGEEALPSRGFYKSFGKRAIDLVLSCVLLIVMCVPMLLIALAIRLTSKGGAIFKQVRIGRGGEPFVCYKFRSMRLDAPSDIPTSHPSDIGRYITPVGGFIRRLSLDELPQIINVIKGDMSLVGVRPLIPCEEEMHKGRSASGVYDLPPGITGLAQIRGRDMISDAEKLEFDREYAKNIGFALDTKIFFETLLRVIRREDIRAK